MATPAPQIFIRPKPMVSSITYTVNSNFATTSSYQLTVGGPSYLSSFVFPQVASPWYKYTVDNLSTSARYSGDIFQTASNAVSSATVSYRTVQTGNKPSAVQNLAGLVSGSNVTLTWNAPSSDGSATIGWYVIRNLLQPAKFNVTGQTFSYITSLAGGSNLFSVEAVNDPGYSPRAFYSTVVSAGIPFNWNLNKYVQLASNAVRSATNVIDWDAYATSDVSRQTNFTITAAPQQTNLQSMFGMASTAAPGFPVYTSMPHCIYTAPNATLYLFDSGNFGPSLGSYSAGDLLTLSFSGSNATYKKNATTIYTKTFTPTTNLYVCATAGIANATYSNITFVNN